jgi:hypothetical protein
MRSFSQEAEIRRKQRVQSIQKANDMLYEQRDKMKLLKSQLMLSDVLAEREQQVLEAKKHKEITAKAIAKVDHENIMKEVHRMKEYEELKIRQAEERVQAVAKTRLEQLQEVKARREAEAEENRQIGMAIKLEAQRKLEEERKAQQEKWEMVKQRNMEFKQANEDLKSIRADLKEKERLAQEARESELDVIENRKIALKRLEQERFDRAQITRQMMIDRAVENLRNMINNDEAKLQQQINEKNAKDESIRLDKENKRKNDLQQLHEAREEQIRRHQAERDRELAEEAKMIELWRKQYNEDMAEEARKQAAQYDFHKSLKVSQYQEGVARRQQRAENRLKEIEEDKFMFEINSHDDDRFIELCKQKLEEYRRAGKPTYPIQRALETTELVIVPAKIKPVAKKSK